MTTTAQVSEVSVSETPTLVTLMLPESGHAIAGSIMLIVIVVYVVWVMLLRDADPDTRKKLAQALGRFARAYLPWVISLLLLASIMDGVQGNLGAQWLLAVILANPLSGWLANIAYRKGQA